MLVFSHSLEKVIILPSLMQTSLFFFFASNRYFYLVVFNMLQRLLSRRRLSGIPTASTRPLDGVTSSFSKAEVYLQVNQGIGLQRKHQVVCTTERQVGCRFAHRVEVTLYLNKNQNSNTLCFPSLAMLNLLQVLKPHGQLNFSKIKVIKSQADFYVSLLTNIFCYY